MTKQIRRLFKIYVLGNLLVEEDSLPLKLVAKLREVFSEIEFIELDPTEELPEEEHFVLIDSVIGLDEVKVLDEGDIDKFELSPQCSLHDFDLGFSLKLAKKLGRVGRVSIIGVPALGDEEVVFGELKKVIEKLLE